MKTDFWTSTEYSGFMVGLIRELNASGVEARQRYQISESSYRAAKSPVARLWLRFRQYVAYPLQLCAALLLQRISHSGKVDEAISENKPSDLQTFKLSYPDNVCVVSTNTFYAPLLATYLHPHVVHLVYDLFPEAMIHSGKWTEGTLKVKVVRWITKQTLKRAKTNVFLGQRLQDYVESIHGAVANAAIIPIGADQALFSESPVERRSLKPQSSSTILYCGNFGNMHDSATLFEYWRQIASAMADGELLMANREIDTDQSTSNQQQTTSNEIAWRFHCSGPKRAALEGARATLPDALQQQIQLGGGLDQTEWIRTMESADVALVTMVPGSETVVMPSKTYSAMMAGQAILAIAPEDSDLVDTIKAADCGWWVAPGDVDGLAQVIDTIRADPEGLLAKRENAYTYAHAQFGQDVLAKKWIQLFDAPAVRDA